MTLDRSLAAVTAGVAAATVDLLMDLVPLMRDPHDALVLTTAAANLGGTWDEATS